MTNQQMLGNRKEKGKLEKLVEQAKKDPLVKGVVKKMQRSRFDVLKLQSCNEARQLLDRVYSKNKAPNKKANDEFVSGYNALLAFASIAYGTDEQFKLYAKYGKELIDDLEEHIKFVEYRDGAKLIDSAERRVSMSLYHNIAFALAYIAAGRKDDALKLIKGIEKHIGIKEFIDGTKLAIDGVDGKFARIDANALLAYTYSIIGRVEDGKKIIKGLEKNVGFDKRTILIRQLKPRDKLDYFKAINNISVALAYFTCGQEKRAQKLLRQVEHHFKKIKNIGGLFDVMSSLTHMANEYYKEK